MDEPKAPPRPRGRPATGQTPKRYFRMSVDEYGLVGKAAKQKGKTISEFIRSTLVSAAQRVLKRNSGGRGS